DALAQRIDGDLAIGEGAIRTVRLRTELIDRLARPVRAIGRELIDDARRAVALKRGAVKRRCAVIRRSGGRSSIGECALRHGARDATRTRVVGAEIDQDLVGPLRMIAIGQKLEYG